MHRCTLNGKQKGNQQTNKQTNGRTDEQAWKKSNMPEMANGKCFHFDVLF